MTPRIFLFAPLLLTSGCALPASTESAQPTHSAYRGLFGDVRASVEKETHGKPQAPLNPNEICTIGILRTDPFFNPPNYTAVIHSDGVIEFSGQDWYRGYHTVHIEPSQFELLTMLISSCDILAMKPKYELYAKEDSPLLVTLVASKRAVREFHVKGGDGPLMLWAVDQAIENVVLKAVADSVNRKAP